jgi:hypothetical protein
MINELKPDLDRLLSQRWGTLAADVRVKRTIAALEANGVSALRASDAAEAKRMVLDLIPDGSEVHQGASQSLDVVGIADEIAKSGRYEALRPRIWSMVARRRGTRSAAWARRRTSCSGASTRSPRPGRCSRLR